MHKNLWPLADDGERMSGWTLSYKFLRAIQLSARVYDPDVSLEQVEAVLMAAQAHALLAECDGIAERNRNCGARKLATD